LGQCVAVIWAATASEWVCRSFLSGLGLICCNVSSVLILNNFVPRNIENNEVFFFILLLQPFYPIVLSCSPPCWPGWADHVLVTPRGLACSVRLTSVIR
jgi:hypothetical protein